MSTRLFLFVSMGVLAAAQPTQSNFGMYEGASGLSASGMSSRDDTRPGSPQWGHRENADAPEFGEYAVSPRPSATGPVSADQLRHPLTGKALRVIKLAQEMITAQDYVHAREILQKAIKDKAAAPYAHSLLGQEYVRSMQFAEAVQELDQAVRALPSNVPDHANLGYALLMTGQSATAEKELRRALELQPANSRTHLVLGILCYTLGTRDREAAEHLEFAARELPGAHLMLARFYRQTGHPDAASREFQTYVQLTGAADSTAARHWFESAPSASLH